MNLIAYAFFMDTYIVSREDALYHMYRLLLLNGLLVQKVVIQLYHIEICRDVWIEIRTIILSGCKRKVLILL